MKKPPFKVEEEGWGEFDLGVTLHYVEKEGTKELTHDLNFQDAKYESPHKLVLPNGVRNNVGLQKPVTGVS
jgi:transcription initiation factor IIF auxiliary subunit